MFRGKKIKYIWNLQRKWDNININCKPIKYPLKAHYKAQKMHIGFSPFLDKKLNRNWSVWAGFGSVLGLFFRFGYFLDKNWTKPKIITPSITGQFPFSFSDYANLLYLHSKWSSVWKCGPTHVFKKIKYFLLKINFLCFGSFWCTDFKNNLKNKKNIILMHFSTKITLKNNQNYTPKQII